MQTIQWFPGHMAKTRRIMRENLSQVDIVLELVDARIPESARNPEIAALTAGKPVLTLLNKSSLADPAVTKAWVTTFRARGENALAIDCVTGEGIGQIGTVIRQILADKVQRYAARGMSGRKLRAMVVGIPNVGKSSLINRLCGGKKVKVEDRPGVTLTKQWVPTSLGLDLMDMPGVLWPKFDDPRTGENLAMTGAIKDDILDTEQLAATLCARLMTVAPDKFCARYKLERVTLSDKNPHELLEAVAKKRGFLLSGGVIDTERAAAKSDGSLWRLPPRIRCGRIPITPKLLPLPRTPQPMPTIPLPLQPRILRSQKQNPLFRRKSARAKYERKSTDPGVSRLGI